MSDRHVHFAASPYPRFPSTPSPSFSNTSLPSPGGPITPPPLGFSGSPYACAPLPSMTCKVTYALRCSSTQWLHYNVSLPPSTLKLHPSIPPHILTSPATEPPLPFMTIISPHLPWSLKIVPSGKHGSYVSIADILEGLYSALRHNVTPAEFQTISPSAQGRVTDAFRHRCQRAGSTQAFEIEKSKGLKRVDFLSEKNMFMGLSSTSRGPEVWQLNVS